ncbi:MAG: ArsR/SmtB family transcription factor [Candidatus Saliniplasma sp.]
MGNIEDDELYSIHADVCKAFTNKARLKIIDQLRDGERSVGELAEAVGSSQSNISQHLNVLKNKDFVKSRKEGNRIYYSVTNKKIFDAFDLIREMIME